MFQLKDVFIDRSFAGVQAENPDEPLRKESDLCTLPRAQERSDRKRETESKATALTDFEKKHGVTVEQKDDKYIITLKANGVDEEIARTEASAKGLEQAEKELGRRIAEKKKHLETTFKVSFSTDGEDVLNQWIEKQDCSWERGAMIKARGPNLNELAGIEAALYRAQPSHLTRDGQQGVKFYFLTDNYYRKDPALAYFISGDKNGRQAVYFEPGANEGKPATEADADRMGKHHLYSIEAVAHHELMHNAQHNMGWSTPKTKEGWARAVGWMPFEDPKTHETKWIFRGKEEDLYRRDKDHCKDEAKWCSCTKAGGLLNAGAQEVASVKQAKHFTGDEIRDRALVKPCTYYFVNPLEMFAEGGMKYRVNERRREELLTESPTLYEAVKKHDQYEINRTYGVDASQQPKYIRKPDGYLAHNTAESRKAIEDFEERVKNKAKDKSKR
ncbi:MAG TPA: hypothetical protein V6D17_09325 [Candidatus Obscuribacterales bacterium]